MTSRRPEDAYDIIIFFNVTSFRFLDFHPRKQPSRDGVTSTNHSSPFVISPFYNDSVMLTARQNYLITTKLNSSDGITKPLVIPKTFKPLMISMVDLSLKLQLYHMPVERALIFWKSKIFGQNVFDKQKITIQQIHLRISPLHLQSQHLI